MTAIGLALGATLLTWVLARVDLPAVGESLRRLTPGDLLPVLAIALLQLPLRPWRWSVSFPTSHPVGFRACFETLAIGNLANYLVPGRGGDFLRCWLVRRRERDTPFSLVLGTLGVEKLLDGIALVAVLGVGGLLLPLPPWLGRVTAVGAWVFGLALVVFVALRARTAGIVAWLDAHAGAGILGRACGWLARTLGPFTAGLAAIGSARRLALLGLQTVLIVAGEAATVWLLADRLGLALSPAAAAVVVAVLGLGFMLPAAPGFVGTYEALAVATLALFGIAAAPATALALLAHAWSFAWTALIGVIGLAMGGLSMGTVMRDGRLDRQRRG